MGARAKARTRGLPTSFGEGMAKAWRYGAFEDQAIAEAHTESEKQAQAQAQAEAALAKAAELEAAAWLTMPRDGTLRLQVHRARA